MAVSARAARKTVLATRQCELCRHHSWASRHGASMQLVLTCERGHQPVWIAPALPPKPPRPWGYRRRCEDYDYAGPR